MSHTREVLRELSLQGYTVSQQYDPMENAIDIHMTCKFGSERYDRFRRLTFYEIDPELSEFSMDFIMTQILLQMYKDMRDDMRSDGVDWPIPMIGGEQ